MIARIRAWTKASPALAISVGLHLGAFLVAALVYIVPAMISDEGNFEIKYRAPEEKKIDFEDLKKPAAEQKENAESESAAANDSEGAQAGEGDGAEDQGPKGSLGVVGGPGDSTRVVRWEDVGRGRQRSVRRGGKKAVKRAPPALEPSIAAGLRWLARHQNSDGSWSAKGFARRCGREGAGDKCGPNAFEGNEAYDVGVSALATLAFLGAGQLPSSTTPLAAGRRGAGEGSDALGLGASDTLGSTVKRALAHLVRVQAAASGLGPETDRAIYNHILAAQALCEGYRLTRVDFIREAAEALVRSLIEWRSPEKGWRYAPRAADSDASVTGGAILALRAAEEAGILADATLRAGAHAWLESVAVEGRIDKRFLREGHPAAKEKHLIAGYLSADDAGKLVSVPGINDAFRYTPSTTALLLLSGALADADRAGPGAPSAARPGGARNPLLDPAIETLLLFPPSPWRPAERESWREVDFYFWYHATLAIARSTASDDPRQKGWDGALAASLLGAQNLAGSEGHCREGSWDPIDRWSCEGGRVYATAMAILALEIHFHSPSALAGPPSPARRPVPLEIEEP